MIADTQGESQYADIFYTLSDKQVGGSYSRISHRPK